MIAQVRHVRRLSFRLPSPPRATICPVWSYHTLNSPLFRVITMSSTTTQTTIETPPKATITLCAKAGEDGQPCFSMGQKTLRVPMSLHAKNRQRLIERFKDAPQNSVIVVQGGEATTRYCSDHEPVFRQESYFQWLFGVMEPDCFGAVHVGSGKSMLFIPKLPQEYAVWMGEIKGRDHFKQVYGVDEVHYVDDLGDVVGETSPERVWLLEGVNTDSGNKSKPAEHSSLEKFRDKVDKEKLHQEMADLRAVKTPEEIEVMRYVVRTSSEAHVATMQHCRPGLNEYQLESTFRHHTYYHAGCRHQSYTCICGSGINSAVLHYGHAGAPNDKLIREGDMLLMDMGSEYHCYGADITCSYPATGKFTQDQKDIYECVLAAQKAVFNALRPGVSWPDMHRLSEKAMLEELKNRGFLQGDVDDMMKHFLGAVFQPHGLGHLLGLDTHDVGGYLPGMERSKEPGLKSLRCGRIVEEGMVLTVEPGCYFIPAVLKPALENPETAKFFVKEKIDRFMTFGGIRLEDDIVITQDGMENFTICPREVEDVEAVMAGAPWPPK